jgi:hypothetical protein
MPLVDKPPTHVCRDRAIAKVLGVFVPGAELAASGLVRFGFNIAMRRKDATGPQVESANFSTVSGYQRLHCIICRNLFLT